MILFKKTAFFHNFRFLIIIPFVLLAVVTYFKWRFPERSVPIFMVGGTVGFLVGVYLAIYTRFKYHTKVRSLAAIMVSLLAMKKVYGFSLMIIAILAFTWFIDYIREIAKEELSPYYSLSGAFFSFGLLLIVAGIIIFLEERNLAGLKIGRHEVPAQTRGLIITLSTISKNSQIDNIVDFIEKTPLKAEQFQQIFNSVIRARSLGGIRQVEKELFHNNYDEKVITFFKILVSTQLYPPLVAIQHHWQQVQYLWILVTPEAEQFSWGLFLKLFDRFYSSQKNIKPEKVKVINPDDVNAISITIDEIYTQAKDGYGLKGEEITSDITSGPSSITAGMILACVRSMRKVQYLGQRDFKLQAINVSVRSIPHLFDELLEQMEIIRGV